VDLDAELEQLAAPAISCRRCGTPYPAHGDAGGPVTVRAGGFSSPAAAVPVTCPGFAWVDPAGSVGGYSSPPSSGGSRLSSP
jgi:hypothetical protein